jgi:ABC-type branched-subunit amino acid transport system ATPase component
MLNLLCGFYAPSSGQILMNSQDLTSLTIQERAYLGLGRTFQKPRLLPTLSALDNALLGAWIQTQSGFLATAFSLPFVRKEEEKLAELAKETLQGVGLGSVLNRPANLLDHGQQRFLEIARALVMKPKFLLLDEPAGGLTGNEILLLRDLIQVIKASGIGVLLVEHHTDFVFRICDRVTTFNVGKMIKHGTPNEVRTDDEVIRVYLGA